MLCPRRDSNSHACAYDPKSYMSTNSITRAYLSREPESNRQPADYKSAALPIELSRHLMFRCKSRALPVHYKLRGFLLDKNLYLQELRGFTWTRTMIKRLTVFRNNLYTMNPYIIYKIYKTYILFNILVPFMIKISPIREYFIHT